MANKKGGLGRGLDSLFNENAADSNGAVDIKLTEIEPNRAQPRKDFDEESLNSLAESIAKHGLIQPIVVCPTASGVYRIIAGERRWRACRIAGLETVPVIIKECDDKAVAEMALVENLQREDLNPVEEALGYSALIENYGLTQEQLAEAVSKSRTAIANTLRLLNLDEKGLKALREGRISAGHARAILAAADEETREKCLALSLAGASVREVERIAAGTKAPAKKERKPKNGFYTEVELSLKSALGRAVSVKPTGKDRGTITLEFYGNDELAEIAKKLEG